MKTLSKLLFLFLLCSSASAATVHFALTNFNVTTATNSIIVTPTNGPVVNSPFLQVGNPIRILTTNGQATTNLLCGTYVLSIYNIAYPRPVVFTVPCDSGSYELTALLTNGFSYGSANPPFITDIIAGNNITVNTNGGARTINSSGGSGSFDGNPNQFGLSSDAKNQIKNGALVTNLVGSFTGNAASLTNMPGATVTGSVPLADAPTLVSQPAVFLLGYENSGKFSIVNTSPDLFGAQHGTAVLTNLAVGLFTNTPVLYVSTNGNDSTATKGSTLFPWRTFTNALTSAAAGDTILLTPGQTHDLSTNSMILSNINVYAHGAFMTFSNLTTSTIYKFKINGPLNWYGGSISNASTSTANSDLQWLFVVGHSSGGNNAFTAKIKDLDANMRSDLYGDDGANSSNVRFALWNCHWKSAWDLFTAGSSSSKFWFEAHNCTFESQAPAVSGNWGIGQKVFSMGNGKWIFDNCSIIASNATTTVQGMEMVGNGTAYLNGVSLFIGSTNSPSIYPLFSDNAGGFVINGHPYPESYFNIGAGSFPPLWLGDATNPPVVSGAISAYANGDRYWSAINALFPNALTNNDTRVVNLVGTSNYISGDLRVAGTVYSVTNRSGDVRTTNLLAGNNLFATNLTQLANGSARVIPTGQFQSDPGSTAGNGNFVAGSINNQLGSGLTYSAITGGDLNTNLLGNYSFIGGGLSNFINATESAVVGGFNNAIGGQAGSSALYSFIGDGQNNFIGAKQQSSAIVAGDNNRIETSGSFDSSWNYIGAGHSNVIWNPCQDSSILGGMQNTVSNNSSYSAVLGGSGNIVKGNYAFAMGSQAKATNQGATVFTDSQATDFGSLVADSFRLRFQGGGFFNWGSSTLTNIGGFTNSGAAGIGTALSIAGPLVSGEKLRVAGNASISGNITNEALTASTAVIADTSTKPALKSLANGGANTFLQGTTPPTYTAVALGAAVSGTLPVANGGTASSTATAGLDVLSQTAEVSLASATTTDLGAQASQQVSVTGTTTITGFGTVAAGTLRFVRFTGALTLTHNATSLILPSGANITTAAGDRLIARSEGSGNWRVWTYTKADGTAVVSSGGGGGYTALNANQFSTNQTANQLDIISGASLTNTYFRGLNVTNDSTGNWVGVTNGVLYVSLSNNTAVAPTGVSITNNATAAGQKPSPRIDLWGMSGSTPVGIGITFIPTSTSAGNLFITNLVSGAQILSLSSSGNIIIAGSVQTGVGGGVGLSANQIDNVSGATITIGSVANLSLSRSSSVTTVNGLLTASGGINAVLATKSADYTLTSTDGTILINGATKTMTLPASTAGRIYTIKLIASGTTGTVATTSSQTIDGSTTYSLSAQYKYVTVQGDGSNWSIIASN